MNSTEAREKLNFLNPIDLLALLIYGEARGEPVQGQIAVAHVALNRSTAGGWFGKGLIGPAGVILKPFQFSCFNENDPNLPKMLKVLEKPDVAFTRCQALAAAVVTECTVDMSKKATHYHTYRQPPGVNIWPPRWANELEECARVGSHVFYKRKGKV